VAGRALGAERTGDVHERVGEAREYERSRHRGDYRGGGQPRPSAVIPSFVESHGGFE